MELVLIDQIDSGILKDFEADFMHILNNASSRLKIHPKACLSVILVNDEQIHEINRDYRKIDRPTDVITFAIQDTQEEIVGLVMDDIEQELGDIFINLDAVIRQAKEYGHSERREMCFLFTHGLLHLLGYDHMNPEDEKVMFGLQHELLDAYIPRE